MCVVVSCQRWMTLPPPAESQNHKKVGTERALSAQRCPQTCISTHKNTRSLLTGSLMSECDAHTETTKRPSLLRGEDREIRGRHSTHKTMCRGERYSRGIRYKVDSAEGAKRKKENKMEKSMSEQSHTCSPEGSIGDGRGTQAYRERGRQESKGAEQKENKMREGRISPRKDHREGGEGRGGTTQNKRSKEKKSSVPKRKRA